MKTFLPYKWQVLIIVMMATLLASLAASIINVSIPALMAAFGSGLDDIPNPPELDKEGIFAQKPEELNFFDDMP